MNIIEVSQSLISAHKTLLIDKMRPLLEGKNVVFFDVPVHGNVGDSLIFLGTIEMLNILNINLIDCISAYEMRRMRNANYPEDTVFIFQGGGNFGDIYMIHQQMRIEAIDRFPNNKIVVFPQSIHYSDLKKLEADTELMKKHVDLHLFVRDEYSYSELLNRGLKNVYLTPDIASVLVDKTNKTNSQEFERLMFKRKDVEATGSVEQNSIDWIDIVPKGKAKALKLGVKLIKLNNKIQLPKLTMFFVLWIHGSLYKTAVDYFSKYKIVQTDRLHGMILSQLIGLKTEALDNSYGKLIRYSKKWFQIGNERGE